MAEDRVQFGFALDATDGLARRGRVKTGRGEVRTPAFMPVGTAGGGQGALSGTGSPGGGPIYSSATPIT